jgi:hypothetical protein
MPRGDHKPHGDKLFQLARRLPVVTIMIERSFDIVHELTADHGVVTSEMVPAVLSIAGPDRTATAAPRRYQSDGNWIGHSRWLPTVKVSFGYTLTSTHCGLVLSIA